MRKNIANYLQQTAADEGYIIAKMVRTGKACMIPLPPPMDENGADANNQKIIRKEAI